MRRENKKGTSVFVDVEVLDHLENNPEIKNLSEWINTRYPDEFMNLNKEEKNLSRLTGEIKQCRERIKIIDSSKEKMVLPKLADKWIREVGIKRYERSLEGYVTFGGILKYFNNKFDLDLNSRQFKIILERVNDKDRRK